MRHHDKAEIEVFANVNQADAVTQRLRTLAEHWRDVYQLDDDRLFEQIQADKIDIALDPSPYNGTTTTCEALIMGVPTLTLAGVTHASRVGHSLLKTVGLDIWVATSTEEYFQKAIAFANDWEYLAQLRAQLPLQPKNIFKRRSPLRMIGNISRSFALNCGRRCLTHLCAMRSDRPYQKLRICLSTILPINKKGGAMRRICFYWHFKFESTSSPYSAKANNNRLCSLKSFE